MYEGFRGLSQHVFPYVDPLGSTLVKHKNKPNKKKKQKTQKKDTQKEKCGGEGGGELRKGQVTISFDIAD